VNFFDAQDRARRATRWLVIVYAISTILIVIGVTTFVGAALFTMSPEGKPPEPTVLAAVAILAALFIFGSSLYKTSRLSSGGGRVALDMGGTLISPDVRDPQRQQLRNIVEEMAIASGVPVPDIYVLEEESGINAFAAGFTSGDAAVAVTRGTLDLLNRDELQGVIAHEFSHIMNGDMRLNIRMMGVLFGIMVLGIIGRLVLRAGYHSNLGSSRRNKSAPVIMIIGLGLAILGWIGVLFARIVKSAVSRQREYLADASAVQFTRQSDGIANALKKIGGYTQHSYIRAADPEEISHMLFANGSARLTSLLATHPPLTKRIQALDPQFKEADYPAVDQRQDRQPDQPIEMPVQSGDSAAGLIAALASGASAVDTSNIADSVGRPQAKHIKFARELRRSIPSSLYAAAHETDNAFLLTLALSLNDAHAEKQLRVIAEQLGSKRTSLVQEYYEQISTAGAAYRLPLLEIAFPALKARPAAQLEFLLDLVRRLIEADGIVDLSEFCLYRILDSQLRQATDPSAAKRGNRVARKAARSAAIDLLRIVADQGNPDAAAREHAFKAGATVFGEWVDEQPSARSPEEIIKTLDRSLDVLEQINTAGQRSLIQAVSNTIAHDGKLTMTEAELLRAICASLDCPLPPILADFSVTP
jgi:Zn-dependent protease with chaperone function